MRKLNSASREIVDGRMLKRGDVDHPVALGGEDPGFAEHLPRAHQLVDILVAVGVQPVFLELPGDNDPEFVGGVADTTGMITTGQVALHGYVGESLDFSRAQVLEQIGLEQRLHRVHGAQLMVWFPGAR